LSFPLALEVPLAEHRIGDGPIHNHVPHTHGSFAVFPQQIPKFDFHGVATAAEHFNL
jgi:hypothetical protein